MIKEVLDMLGHKAVDRVTGFEGVISSACFDLCGCVQVALTPTAVGKDEAKHGNWFDVSRVKIEGEKVMAAPDFDARGQAPAQYDSGPAGKPAFASTVAPS